jgi:hypothetical protein
VGVDNSEKHIVNLTYSDLLPKSACYLLLVVLSFFIASSLFSGDVCHCFSLKGDSAGYEKLRYEMVEKQIAVRDIKDGNVLQAMRNVPRHLFVPAGDRRSAYGDFPLAIGYGQTISQPYIVALMTELLEPEEHDVALEVGTGSGWLLRVGRIWPF